MAVFVEPQIASGFPDIVLASYLPKILDGWSDEREKLNINDFKVLSYLVMSGGASGENLIIWLGLSEKAVLRALENLLDAKMVLRINGVWKPVDIKKTYHIKN